MSIHDDSLLLRENDELATELSEERALCNRLREALEALYGDLTISDRYHLSPGVEDTVKAALGEHNHA